MARLDPNGAVVAEARAGIHEGRLNRVLFSAGSRTMATVGVDGMLRLWPAGEGREPSLDVKAHDKAIHGASFNRTGDLIATSSSDRLVKVWNVADGTPAAEPVEHDRTVRDVAFGLPGDLLVSVSSDGTTRVWSPFTGAVTPHPFAPRTRPLRCVSVSADGEHVAVGGYDGVVRLWAPGRDDAQLELAAHTDQVKALAFHPTDSRLASGGMDRSIALWDVATGGQLGKGTHRHNGTVYALAFSPDGSLLASGSYDGTMQAVPSAEPDRDATTITSTKSSIRSIAFSPDGATLVGATDDGSILMCSTARAEVSGAELLDVRLALESLVELTR